MFISLRSVPDPIISEIQGSKKLPPALLLLAGNGTSAHVQLLDVRLGTDIKVEDVGWKTKSCASIGDVDDTCQVALNRRTRQEEVNLVVGVTCKTI